MRRYVRSRKGKAAMAIAFAVAAALWAIMLFGEGGVVDTLTTPDTDSVSRETNVMYLTVPEMARVENLEVKTGGMQNEQILHDSALHVRGTGFPWKPGSNVYIAGHRLGFPKTDSWLVFADINKLEPTDKIYIRDDAGNRWTYEVIGKKIVDPHDMSVTRPVPGKDLITLQSCTYPLYRQRIVVIGEMV